MRSKSEEYKQRVKEPREIFFRRIFFSRVLELATALATSSSRASHGLPDVVDVVRSWRDQRHYIAAVHQPHGLQGRQEGWQVHWQTSRQLLWT